MLGTDAGVLWIIAGVWTVRAMAGSAHGLAWGIACAGACVRWGTLSLGDVAVATRIAGPTVVSGSFPVRTGVIVAVGAALLGETQTGGLRATAWGERAAAAAAVVALVSLFFVRGPGDPVSPETILWVAASIAVTLVVVLAKPVADRVPAWIAPLVALVGAALAALGA